MRRISTNSGFTLLPALLVVLLVVSVGGGLFVSFQSGERNTAESTSVNQNNQEKTSEENSLISEEDEVTGTSQMQVKEEDPVVEPPIEDEVIVTKKVTTVTETHISSPASFTLARGESVLVDGTTQVTLVSVELYERMSGGQADFRVTQSGGCGEGAPAECLGPPGYQKEFSFSESSTEPIEAGGYSFVIESWGTNSVTVHVQKV